MTYPINIIINNRIWYDSRIEVNNPVVFQNVNYATGDPRSVNVVRQRFIQDWARRIIPNSIRQGIGLTDPVGDGDEIDITQGYAVVGGRFLDIPTGTWDALTGAIGGGSISVGLNYLMIRVSPETEGDGRIPALESADVVGILIASYTRSHDDLILAKFNYDGVDIDQFEDYTAEQEWQANIISPVPARPGTSTGSDNILMRAGYVERIDNLGIETDKTRFYLNAVFNDQDVTPIEEVKLINYNATLQVTDVTRTDFLGMDMLELATGLTIAGTAITRIDSSGNLLNIGTINTGTIGGDSISADIVDRGSIQTLDNKTLTSPTQTGGTLNAGGALTVDSTELNQLDTVDVGGNTSGDIITTDDTQTMTSKTLTTPVIATLYQTAPTSNLITFPSSAQTLVGLTSGDTLSNKILDRLEFESLNGTEAFTFIIDTPSLTANKTLFIRPVVDDYFVFESESQILTNKTLTSPNINEAVALTATATELNQLDGVIVGGTSSGDIVDLDTIQTLTNKTLPEIDAILLRGSSNAEWVHLSYYSQNNGGEWYQGTYGVYVAKDSVSSSIYFILDNIPFNRGSESLRVARVRVTALGDATNYILQTASLRLNSSNIGSSNVLSSDDIGDGGTVETLIIDPADINLSTLKRWGIRLSATGSASNLPSVYECSVEIYYA